MSRELTDAEYVEMLVDGNTAIFWHSLSDKPDSDEIDRLVKDTVHRAVAQVMRDRAGVNIPSARPVLQT